MKTDYWLLGIFAVGVGAGMLKLTPDFLTNTDTQLYLLYALFLLVGIAVGSDPRALQTLFSLNVRVFLIPVGIVIGSLAGAGLISFLLPNINLREGVAVGAGFGYYSLSSILISMLHTEELGVVALLSNILRETGTILLAPVFVRVFGELAPIASGGATTMDTTLPVIQKYSGKKYVVIAVINGVLLTLLVPIIIPLLFRVK
jgi:uncharacterized membrane protein YbjE (DUF340 family)